MKRCCTCKRELPFSAFNRNRSVKDGLQYSCRECKKQIDRQHYASSPKRQRLIRESNDARRQERADAVNAIKAERGCTDCGEDDPIVLDFDHILDNKEHNVANLVSHTKAWDVIQAEIDKCEVVCANCHRRRTHARRQASVV